jgi:hypothetical protein
MPLGPEVLSALDYWATDEGIAERNARPEMREPSGISLGVDGFGKALQQRRDDVKDRDINLYEARDPFKEAAQFAGPNMRPKMLSGDAIKNGGTGDWDIVKYPTDHARAGEPVKVRDMVLGQMPEAKAKARNEHYRARGNNMLKQISEKWKAEGGKTAVADQ